jgi:ABC-type nitrate/sulfonate/bicarbonate transport system permease component
LTIESPARKRTLRFPAGLVAAIVALVVWQLVTAYGPLKGTSIPTASATMVTLVELLGQSSTYIALWETIQMALVGFLIAVLIALPVGTMIGLSKFAFRSTKFTFDFFKVIPPIVIIPITILVFGPSIQMGIFLVTFSIVFALAIQTAYGIRDADVVLLETMRCYGLGTIAQIRYARIPSAAPFIAVGIRISVAAAIVVSVVAGLIGGAPGLGRSILLAQSGGLNEQTFALVFLLGILGIIVSRAVIWSQGRLLFWIPR